MDGTILSQGSFIVPATVVNQVVAIPSNADWMWVRNYTQIGTAGVAATGTRGYDFYWQRGMPAGSAIVKYKTVTTNAAVDDLILTGGFTLYDPSAQSSGSQPVMSAPVATTASTNATRPVVSTASTAGISVGTIIRMSNTAQIDVNAVDMVVSAVTANTSFTLLEADNALATAPGAIGGAGFYRIVNYNALFYPRRRFVTNVTAAAAPTVSTSIPHGLTPGQSIRFNIPKLATGAVGMTQLDGQLATVVSVTNDRNFVINIDTSAYTAFVWPTIAQGPSSFPHFNPVGENTAVSLATVAAQVPSIGGLQINGTQSGILADSTVNTGYLGMLLGTGAAGVVLTTAITGPAGSVAADVVYWVAGKSSFGGL